MADTLERALWPTGRYRTYAVVDAAAAGDLLGQLYSRLAATEFVCLWPGDLAPDMAYVAPYLAVLDAGSPFAQWFLNGWGKHWGVALVVPTEITLSTLASHLRRFNMTTPPGAHAPAYFRWYDPRVLREHAASAPADQVRALFGPADRIVIEAGEAAKCDILLPPAAAPG